MADKAVTAAQVADKAVDKVSDFVTIAAEKATNVFEAAANILTDAVATYGPQAVDAVLWVVRFDAVQYLVIGWLMFIVAMSGAIFAWTGFTRRNWRRRWIEGSEGDNFLQFIMGLVLFITVILTGIHSIGRVTDVWQYVAVAKPELYLAKQAVDIVKAKLMPQLPQKQ